tara:strand:+ start:978 stop:1799 length:822 start_codon:yes stop_codon:yes gene_type:complete
MNQISLAYLTVFGLAPPDHVSFAAQAGYDAVGLRLVPALPEEEQFPMTVGSEMLRETLSRLSDTGLSVLDVENVKLNRFTDPVSLTPIFDAMAELGTTKVLVTSDAEDESLNIERLSALCEFGSTYGLDFHLEFMPWTLGVATLEQAERIVSAAGAPNAHLMIDAIHYDRTGGTLEKLAALSPGRFRYIQLCDAPKIPPQTDEDILHQGRFERQFPGDGGLDLFGVMAALPAGIPISLEAPRRSLLEEVGYEEIARRSFAATRKWLEEYLEST